MAWGTSSSAEGAARIGLGVLLALAGAARCVVPPPALAGEEADAAADPWREARDLLAEGLFLESSMGDYGAACDLYERGLQIPDIDHNLRAELMYRLATGRERLGSLDSASATLEALLEEHLDQEPWAGLAQTRLQRLAEYRHRIVELPVRYEFDRALGDWLHAGSYLLRGGLEWTGETGHDEDGAMLWLSPVTSQARDDIYLAFSTPSPPVRSVEIWVRALEFPAHLILLLVEEGGSRFASARYVIEPADGWTLLRSEIEDFFLFPGEDVTRHPDPIRVTSILIEDATATYSTDRGINRILVDDVVVE